jgi:deoxyribonuclease-4
MIRFGPSGIPLSCKGRTLRDGIEDVHALGLTAMEIQLVRLSPIERFVSDEEVGQTPMSISGELVVEVLKPDKEGNYRGTSDLNVKLKQNDKIRTISTGLVRSYKELRELGQLAKNLDIQLAAHAPYYMDLAGCEEDAAKCVEAIKWCGLIAAQLGVPLIVTHIGLYGQHSKQEAREIVLERVKEIPKWFKKYNINLKLGFETSGRQEVFGSLDEILWLCERVENSIPVLSFPHIHSREGGSLKTKHDFYKLFKKVEQYVDDFYYTNFSGVEHEFGNEIRFTPIKKGDLRFEPFADCLLDTDYEVTVISSSPLLEHDAMYMRVILERVLARREAKLLKKKQRKGKGRKQK